MKIQTINLEIRNELEDGVFAISLVENPAIEENWVALSKEQIELKVIDDEKRIVVGFALVPDKEIYRKQKVGGVMKEFNIRMSKDTVSKAAELFMKNLNGKNFTSEHEKPEQGVSVIESWIVEDAKNDKSNIYKLGAKGGEWVVMSKIYNDDVWNEIKEGKYKGYSIEAMFQGFEQLQSKELTIIEELEQIINTK